MLALLATHTAASAGEEILNEANTMTLEGLRRRHPRIIAHSDDWRRIKSLAETDDTARGILETLHAEALALLGKPPVEYELVGPRLLTQSRRCLDRVYTLATVYRITGAEHFAGRAADEMLAAAAFPDWNPSHFLDTAEMTHALAVGYDWLYDELSADERAIILNAIVEKGLKPALPLYESDSWQVACKHNWNQVCNGGLTIGALAIADEEPELAAHIVENAVRLLPNALASYAPDGGWAEGPGYWGYATRYTCYMLAALESALGHDFGLSEAQGFAETGYFPIHFSGPTGRTFNYADGSDWPRPAAHEWYLARRFDRPVFASYQRRHLRHAEALDLVWYSPEDESPADADVPLDSFYEGIDVAFMRGAWGDEGATFVGFKGGDNDANHSHLDLGTFVLDALGKRWAVDLGPDDYNLPGYFGAERYTYYRLATRSHNTLCFGGENQARHAKAPIVSFTSRPQRACAVADLTAAYAGHAESVRRGVALVERRAVLVQDEITPKDGESEVTWRMLTPAEIELDGARAVLSLDGAALEARIASPGTLEFETAPAAAPERERQQPDVTELIIRMPLSSGLNTLAVLFTPLTEEGGIEDVPIEALDEWGAN